MNMPVINGKTQFQHATLWELAVTIKRFQGQQGITHIFPAIKLRLMVLAKPKGVNLSADLQTALRPLC